MKSFYLILPSKRMLYTYSDINVNKTYSIIIFDIGYLSPFYIFSFLNKHDFYLDIA